MRPQRGLIVGVLLIAFLVAFSSQAESAASFTRTKLPNGLTIIVKPEKGSGIVAIEVLIKAGAAEEREWNAGIGNLVARTLLASTRNRRAETVAAVVDGVGGNLQSSWNRDYTEIRAVVVSSGFDETVRLVGDILNNASFEQKWVDKARQETLADIYTEGDDVFQKAYAITVHRLYRDNPYRRPISGYDRAIRNLKAEDLQRFHSQYYVPNNIVISIVGDVTAEHAVERMKIAFAGTSSHQLPRQLPIPDEALEKSSVDIIEQPIEAAYFLFGFLAPSVNSPDYPAARVLATVLGGGKGSRMFRALREEKGLAYELGTIYPISRNQSHIVAYLVTDPYRRIIPGITKQMMLDEIKQATLAEIARLQNETISAEELERAKRYTIGTFALAHQRIRDRALHLAWLETIGPGAEMDSDYSSKIEAVTAEQVQQAAKEYFTNYALTIALPETLEESAK